MVPEAVIRSASNPTLRRVRAVRAGLEREWLLLEGDRLIEEARAAGLELDLVLLAEERAARAGELAGHPVRLVQDHLLQKVSALKSSPGVLALVRAPRPRSLSELGGAPDSLVLVIAGVADPGNLGALVRAAEAAGARGVAVVEGGAGPWNEKAVRGSMGSLLRLPIAVEPDAERAAGQLRRRGFRQLRAATRGGADYRDLDWSGPIALWVGSETGELPVTTADFEGVTIPMSGRAESLNVTVAASILMFASGRSGGDRP